MNNDFLSLLFSYFITRLTCFLVLNLFIYDLCNGTDTDSLVVFFLCWCFASTTFLYSLGIIVVLIFIKWSWNRRTFRFWFLIHRKTNWMWPIIPKYCLAAIYTPMFTGMYWIMKKTLFQEYSKVWCQKLWDLRNISGVCAYRTWGTSH